MTHAPHHRVVAAVERVVDLAGERAQLLPVREPPRFVVELRALALRELRLADLLRDVLEIVRPLLRLVAARAQRLRRGTGRHQFDVRGRDP